MEKNIKNVSEAKRWEKTQYIRLRVDSFQHVLFKYKCLWVFQVQLTSRTYIYIYICKYHYMTLWVWQNNIEDRNEEEDWQLTVEGNDYLGSGEG